MSLIKLLKVGQNYMQICPQDQQLAFSFSEIKIIRYVRLAMRYVPPLIVFLIFWQYFLHAELAVIMIAMLFAISLPVQGLFWLGKRAQSPLPLNLLAWYAHLKQKLVAKQIIKKESTTDAPIHFIDFMQMLNLAKHHLGSYFGDDDE